MLKLFQFLFVDLYSLEKCDSFCIIRLLKVTSLCCSGLNEFLFLIMSPVVHFWDMENVWIPVCM